MSKTNKSILISILFICLFFLGCIINPSSKVSEVSPVNSLNTIRTLQAQYASKNQGKYATNFEELIERVQLSEDFKGEKPVVNDYVFEMKTNEPNNSELPFYSLTATPKISDSTGIRSYYYDSTIRTIRFTEENRQATKDDPSI